MVPFVPFFRVKEVVDATVGGAYLFGAELWAPFIPRAGRTPGCRIDKDVLPWIPGLRNARDLTNVEGGRNDANSVMWQRVWLPVRLTTLFVTRALLRTRS